MNDKDLAKTAWMTAWKHQSTAIKWEDSIHQKTAEAHFERWWEANHE